MGKIMTQTIFGNKAISSLYINNKEVQSIITSDNVVLYEKESTPILSELNNISISASKYILSEYDNDTCVLSAIVTDENNNTCSNQTVTFKSNNTVLGTAITNSNGVATYTYNSQGVGEFYASASIDNLSSNSLLIEDCKYYKETVSSNITPQVPISSYTIIEFDVIKKVNQSGNASATLQVGNNTDYVGIGYGASANTIMYFFERTSSVSILQQNSSPYLTLNKTYHVKLIITGTTAIMVIGDNQYVIKDIGVSLDKLNKIEYNSNALISNVKVNDIKVSDSISLSASKILLSDYDDSNAFNDWTGTYTTGTDKYQYLTPTNNTTFNKTLPSEFELKYKFKTKTTGTSGTGLLWLIGTDANNCVLIGHEPSDRRIRLYSRINGSNTSRYIQNYAFNFQEWTDTKIRYEDNIISITVNNNTLSYELSDVSLLKSYDTYNQLEIADIIITDLNTGEIVSDSSNNSIVSASVVDSNDNPVKNGVVVFDDEISEEIKVTNGVGVCQYEYVSQGFGDVLINANTGNANDSLLLEDCQYYNDGSSINGLDVKSGVSCNSDGEWITITTSTSGEKFVYPPVCYTGDDNWEVSFKCKTSDFSNQAFGLQMENCGTTTYSGDSQYTAYNTSKQFANCMGAGNKSYSNLSDNDKITFRRVNGYWRLHINDTTEIFNRQYNWTNSRVPGFYTNSGRVQRLKELKYKLIRTYDLTINAPSLLDTRTNNTITGILTDNLNNPIINKSVNLLVNDTVVDTQTTNKQGIVSFNYLPNNTLSSLNLKLLHTNNNSNYSCVSTELNIPVYNGLLLETDTKILSQYSMEDVVLTATYEGGSGHTVEISFDNTTDIMIDNGDGTYSYTYDAMGSGEVTFTASVGNISSSCIIEDCIYYNDGTILSDLTIDSNVSVSVENDYMKITKSSSGEAYVTYPISFTNNDNFVIEMELAKIGTTQSIALWLNNATTANGLWVTYEISQSKFSGGLRSSSINYPTSFVVGDKVSIKQLNGVISIYKNDETIISKTTSFNASSYKFGHYTNSGRVQYVKNIKIKKL